MCAERLTDLSIICTENDILDIIHINNLNDNFVSDKA